jgi:uncharacterized protein YecE (DUF72 family)
MAQAFIGTSGFAYASWKPAFYPEGLPAKRFLEYYANNLSALEVNYTFRTLPPATTFEKWIAATPETFKFAPKAHMRITHLSRLKNVESFTQAFLAALEPLRAAGRLGPILFQLPETFRCNATVLGDFLNTLPREYACAFEFRHPSWFVEEVFALFRTHGAALCIAESEELISPEVVTARFVCYRFRNPPYDAEAIAKITARIAGHLSDGLDVYAFFKHEDDPRGALYAGQVIRALQQPR